MTFTIDAAYTPLTAEEVAAAWDLDPLGNDRGDYLVVDRLEIVRIALVASEVGARFQRDGISVDPMGWMLGGSPLFGGRPPIEACRRKDACSLALLVHSLGLPTDIDAGALQARVLDAEIIPLECDEGLMP